MEPFKELWTMHGSVPIITERSLTSSTKPKPLIVMRVPPSREPSVGQMVWISEIHSKETDEKDAPRACSSTCTDPKPPPPVHRPLHLFCGPEFFAKLSGVVVGSVHTSVLAEHVSCVSDCTLIE